MSRIALGSVCALAAGLIAIVVNIAVLDCCDALGIVTARGGLQKLARLLLTQPFSRLGVPQVWASLGLPMPDQAAFMTGFKVGAGLLMALAHAVLFEPWLVGSAVRRGLIAAFPFWAVNAYIVLPALGEGPAGVHTLTLLGLVCYALAHTVFFVVLAVAYRGLRDLAGNRWGGRGPHSAPGA